MKARKMEETVEIPSEVESEVDKFTVKLKGPKGESSREFKHPKIRIEKKEGKVILSSENATKREKKMIGTFKAHIRNMIKGVTECHTYRLKICSGHFPMNVSVSGTDFIVKNFLGEKIPRILKLKEGVKVKVEGQEVVVESVNKEAAGQTAADIEKLTTIKGRDKRIFQDGVYIINKDGKDMLK